MYFFFNHIYSIQLLSKSNSTAHILLCFNQEDEVMELFLYPTIIQVQKIADMYKHISWIHVFFSIHKKKCLLSFHLIFYFYFLGRGDGNTLYLFMLYYTVVRSIAHFFRFSNNLNCVEEIIKTKKKTKKKSYPMY